MNSYQSPENGQKYLNFLDSPDGQVQREILGNAIFESLPDMQTLRVLDAACGSGWLTAELSKKYDHVQGFDDSEFLLHHAKKLHPEINIAKASADGDIPYPDSYFDIIVLNMAASDIENLERLYANLARVLKPNGKVIATIPNPAYIYPVAVWKRGIVGWLFKRKPSLKLVPWEKARKAKFPSKHSYSNYYHPLSEQVRNAARAQFMLHDMKELRSDTDSPEFGLRYQLYRFPLFLLLHFIKRSE